MMSVQLLDLPIPLLARIAALVSKGNRCVYGVFPFQVIASCSELKALMPLQKCCRKLHEASQLALGGLNLAPMQWSHSIRGLESVARLALSLPCLAELRMLPTPGPIPELLEQVKDLKCLEIMERPVGCRGSWGVIEHFPSVHSLRELIVGKPFTKENVANLLSFRYECLTTLHFVDNDSVPPIPQRILNRLETFIIEEGASDAGNENEILLNLTNAPLLSNLRVPNGICDSLSKLP